MTAPVPPFLTIAEAGRLIAAKRLSPVDLVKHMLARIEVRNPELGAYLLVTERQALAAARAAERAVMAGKRGPLLGIPLAIVIFTIIYLRAQRGSPLPETPILAEESHGSRAFAVLFLLIAIIELAAAYAIPLRGARTGMALSSAFFLLIAAHTWSGFNYRFTSAGLEISTLGYRLRSIPQAQIADYRPEKWMALRGYGIRGAGKTRAYVWGNDVVHITTHEGEVFLGTNDPARTVRDLDMMKHSAHT